MKRPFFSYFFFLSLFPLCAALSHGAGEQHGEELLLNRSFSEGSEETPDHWNSENWDPIDWSGPDLQSITFSLPKPRDFISVWQDVRLPDPQPAAVLLSAEVKMQGVKTGGKSWHSGRLTVTYYDEDGEQVGDVYSIQKLSGTSDWQPVRQQFPVLKAAQSARLELQLLHPDAGKISFRRISLKALSHKEAEAWRIEANERIQNIRMADLKVSVTGSDGQPLPGASVKVFMRQHSYPFGSAVKTAILASQSNDVNTRQYKEFVANFLNYVTLENALKSHVFEQKDTTRLIAALDWLQPLEIDVRGHVLTWPSFEMSPESQISAANQGPDALRATMRTSFDQRLSTTSPYRLVDWDVVNEPANHNDLIQILGDDAVADWFYWAAEGAPNAQLFINENNITFDGGNQKSLLQWATMLQELGAPIGGIGWQGHMWHRTLPSGQNVLDDLDRFAPLELPVQITEYDTNARFSEEDSARFLNEFLTAWFSHPLTNGFIMWGLKDDLVWNRNSTLFRSDWSLKPSGKVWMDLVFDQWWTEETGMTNAQGNIELKGFLGDYEIEVVHDNNRTVRQFTLHAPATHLQIQLTGSQPDSPTLTSSNPYKTGKLPKVVKSEQKEVRSTYQLSITQSNDIGLSPGPSTNSTSVYTISASTPQSPSQDLFLRFSTKSQPGQEVSKASLSLPLTTPLEEPLRLQFHALSHRLVPQQNESGLDWNPKNLSLGSAPARDPNDGTYRTGDAAAIFLGEAHYPKNSTSPLTFSSPELARVIQSSTNKGLTLIVTPTSGSASIEAEENTPHLQITTSN
tara:strand:- start:25704 stop:28100 length:2397 start_codon:yes stop_codon:yes gene_type:complete